MYFDVFFSIVIASKIVYFDIKISTIRGTTIKYNVRLLKKSSSFIPYFLISLTFDVRRYLRIAPQINIRSASVITPPVDRIIMVTEVIFLSGRFVLDGGWSSDKNSIPFNIHFVIYFVTFYTNNPLKFVLV